MFPSLLFYVYYNEGIKILCMEKNTVQKEILLLTGTTFSSRQYHDNDGPGNSRNLSPAEQLEEACWNGLLYDMLPEIFDQPAPDEKKLYLWEIKEGKSFLEVELGEFPEEKDNYFSIDPYSFMETKMFS
jgi:hypothetical protein